VVESWRRQSWALIALGASVLTGLPVFDAASPDALAAPTPMAAQSAGSVQLKVRRLSNAIELVIEGTGAGPQLVQSSSSSGWQGQLTTAAPNGLRLGPQRLSIPEAGLQEISLTGSGTSYQIDVKPTAGLPVSRPVVSADGQSMILTFAAVPQATLQTARPNLNQPGAIPQPSYAPPLQPRAVAPPVGDMAVGTMVLRNTSFVNVRGPRVTMTLRNAPAKDALMALAQMGGYGFVFVDEQSALSATPPASPIGTVAGSSESSPQLQARGVSIAFVNEQYSRAVNAVLLASGLTAKLEGNLLIVGLNVGGKGFGSRLSKVYRLNQVSPEAAADYLANLGASVTKTNTITTAVSQGVNQTTAVSGGPSASTTQSVTQTTVESYGATRGPLLGLGATTDNRLGTITLIGDAAIVGIAEQYLRQLDLRQRQVALSVKILDVNLDNNLVVDNSFAARWGDTFIVNDNGSLLGAFGANLPPSADTFSQNPVANPVANPGLAYPDNSFSNFLKASVNSQSAKVVASPTLILQENPSILRQGSSSGSSGGASGSSGGGSVGGLDDYSIDAPIGRSMANEGVVRVGVNVPTEVSSSTASGGGPTTCTIGKLSTAGLVLGARVQKIDDNGFVTFTLSPSISAVEREISAGGGCPPISILRVRRLDTGVLRVRDGQTLILTGVISDFDRQEVRKWPIVGDIPLIGQFFRSSRNPREKRELVIMVTPKIINDDVAGSYGYGFQPASAQVRQFMGQE